MPSSNGSKTAASLTLYVPPAYRAEKPEQIVRAYPFAQLISEDLVATAVPLLFEQNSGDTLLVGHMSRANPHAARLQTAQDVLAIFSGPHAYISPRSYLERPSVPTWNYLLAQVRGRLDPVTEPDEVLSILHQSVEYFEAGDARAWGMADAPPGKIDSLLNGIFTFRISVNSIEGATKLSQIQPEGDRARIIDELLSRQESRELGQVMQAHYLQPGGA